MTCCHTVSVCCNYDLHDGGNGGSEWSKIEVLDLITFGGKLLYRLNKQLSAYLNKIK